MPESQPNALSLPFVEALYADFLADPESVPEVWRHYFEQLRDANGFASRPQLLPSFPRQALFGVPKRPHSHGTNGDADADGLIGTFLTAGDGNGSTAAPTAERGAGGASADADFARSAEALFRSYRARGHLIARIDPLGSERPMPADLEPRYFGFTEADLD